MNVATCLQKRAYDTVNDMASDMHKQMVRKIQNLKIHIIIYFKETTIFHIKTPQQGSTITEGQHQTSPSSRLSIKFTSIIVI